jgi:hypothetical protein
MTFYTAENEDIQPSYEEVTYVIKYLKYYKASVTDQIITELLKKRRRESMEKDPPSYKTDMDRVQNTQKVVYGNHTTHTKERGKLEFSNYRAVTLLNVTYNVISGILCSRVTEYAEEILGEHKRRYRAHRSIIDHTFTIK